MWRPKEHPNSAPRAPKRSPREPQNVFKTIFRSKTLTFSKHNDIFEEVNIFESGRVSLGAQNRPQEVPKRDKRQHRRSPNHLRQQEASKRGPRELEDESGGPLWSIQKPERAPQGPPRAPKRSPGEPENAFKTIFGSKTLIFKKC